MNFQEMEQWFYDRTKRHIGLVQKYCKRIYELKPEAFKELLQRSIDHDQSKFQEPEKTPYIYLTWMYKQRAQNTPYEIPDNIKSDTVKATEHHVRSNRHHPEYHDLSSSSAPVINAKDRDKPSGVIVDGSEMTLIDIAEMIADWCAVAEERNTCPRKWAKDNIGTRWLFTNRQQKQIYILIDKIFINHDQD